MEEENEFVDIDPQLVAELLQVLAQHTIRQQSNDENNAFPEGVQNVDMNSARVTHIDDEYRLSLLVELQDNQQIRPCVRANHQFWSILTLLKNKNIPSKWKPLYDLLETAFKQAIQSLRSSTYFS